MKKIYTTKYSKLVITLERGGLTAEIEFKNGRMNENVPGRFITSDPTLQYLIERDARFGHLFRLEKAIPTPEEMKASQEKAAKKEETNQKKDVTIVASVTDIKRIVDAVQIMKNVTTTDTAFLIEGSDMRRPNSVALFLFEIVANAEQIRTAMVTVFIPPAVPAGEPPINIKNIDKIPEAFVKSC